MRRVAQALALVSILLAQVVSEDDLGIPPPQPAPVYAGARLLSPVHRDSDRPWGLSDTMTARLAEQAERHAEFALRFTCDETVYLARYGGRSSPRKEKNRKFAYFLVRNGPDGTLAEYRRKLYGDGRGSFRDDDLAPPPHAWWSLFSIANRSYFSFRFVGERTLGFERAHEIQFRGVLPYSGGEDIREWEGTILLDAATGAPLSIVAEPRGQRFRLQEVLRRYRMAFKFMGISLRKRPLGVRLEVAFGSLHEGRRFPTHSRVDRFQAVSSTRVVLLRASTRLYDEYRFTRIDTEQELGPAVE